ncbi:DMT family transporter [Alienimonas sp. DA493]|uniref:DMT family transporter n=1 Tax=Alienimonas sp. DA493 TaxID=3373605 RepID=UPI0037545E69
MTTPAPPKAPASAPVRRAGPSKPLPWRAAAVCILLSILWGGTPASIRVAGDSVPPIFGAAIRFWLASLFMLGWCVARGERLWPRRGEWRPCGLLGVFLFVQIALYHTGVAATNASHAALFINTFVFWTAIIEHFVTRDDRLTGVRWAGLAVAATGVCTVLLTAGQVASGNGTPATLRGDLITAFSGFLLGAKIVATKRTTKRVPPGTLILWHDILGAAMLLALAVGIESFDPSRLTTEAVLALLYQGLLVGGFCFGAQTALLERYSASRVTAFNAATPVWGVAIAVLMLGDPLSPWLFVAAGAVAVGIVLINKRPGATVGRPLQEGG